MYFPAKVSILLCENLSIYLCQKMSIQSYSLHRGHFEEYLYDASGALVETVDMVPGGDVLNIPAGQWHSLRSLESGTVLFEAKDGPWEPQADEDVLAAGPDAMSH